MQTVQQDLAHLLMVPGLSSTKLSSGTGDYMFGR
jgi:hypothetical protein